ncbi:unnamed protein product [Nippostrongylus brasiliensis]|uniref:Uncharacterized protein n=1 Tax=Nippostrongylus brasiliensis TaxID=27835 RepID=A0A0N4XPZ4_NIPBR|nr:unnamed protein product [Nippostrongylus brasiliensis]
MPTDESKIRASPVGTFFARLGRRVRSKSPVAPQLSNPETPKRPSSRGAQVDAVNGDLNDDWNSRHWVVFV